MWRNAQKFWTVNLAAKTFLTIAASLILLSAVTEGCGRIVCVYDDSLRWALNSTAAPSDITSSLCHVIVYKYALVQGNTLIAHDGNNKQFIKLISKWKERNSQLKVHLTLQSTRNVLSANNDFLQMIKFNNTRAVFIKNCVNFLHEHQFDGLDLHFVFSKFVLISSSEILQFVSEIRFAFDRTTPKLQLTAQLMAQKELLINFYGVKFIVPRLDWVYINYYFDFEGLRTFDGPVRHPHPVFKYFRDPDDANLFNNQDYNLQTAVEVNIPKEKIHLNLPIYGRSYTLLSLYSGVGAAGRLGRAGIYTKKPGIVSYFEVCKLISEGAQQKNHGYQQFPYLLHKSQWIGFENNVTMEQKINHLRGRVGGYIADSVNYDDYSGTFCGKGSFPMLRAMKDYCESKGK